MSNHRMEHGNLTCEGSYALRTACGKCSRCMEELARMEAEPGIVRIRSDGTPQGTTAEVKLADGSWQKLQGVGAISFHIRAGRPGTAQILLSRTLLDVQGECRDIGAA